MKALSDKKALNIALKKVEEIIDKEGISDQQTVGEYMLNRLLNMIRSYIELPQDKEKLLVYTMIGKHFC